MNIKHYLNQLNRHYKTGVAGEHAHRPALGALLNALPDVLATNEPRQIECGAPDFVLTRGGVPLGYVEAKDIGKNLDDNAHKAQLARYLDALNNLIFTNYTEFRLYRHGDLAATAAVAVVDSGGVKPSPKNFAALKDLLTAFAGYDGKTITTAADLAGRMAVKARMLASVIERALKSDEGGDAQSALHGQVKAFRKHLIHGIDAANFADIYAQTVAYGMFAARLHDPTPATFTRREAAELIPAANPFLRKFFSHIAGFELDQRIHWIVDDLADVFRAADVGELMKDYGKATQRNDPFLHFYETFLGEYNPRLRKSRGVYYTPEPVVNFIVRAVDEILRGEFDLPKGLADTTKITIKRNRGATDEHDEEVHKVQILDPATGTGTFLAAIVRHIYDQYFADQKGTWPDYARDDLIPRLNGFEVLMASYAMAHTKLEMVLRESNCELGDERLRIFLTNSLEEYQPDTVSDLALWLSTEGNEANHIKRDTPMMVVIGNPPYSGESANKGAWIADLLKNYKQEPSGGKLQEKNSKWLNDDYVKFIRYGQHYIDRNGVGVLAYINNHGYLDNPTFRGMRWSLLQSFDKIYIVDLHGNAKKKETAPDGSADKNVFDIMQGVSINLFVKTGAKKKNAPARVFHHDLYGLRESKHQFLWSNDIKQVDFAELKPQAPQYFFVPKDYELQNEYDKGFSVNKLFETNGVGITTAHDDFVIDADKDKLQRRFKEFKSSPRDEEFLHREFNVRKKKGWNILKGYDNLKNESDVARYIRPISYRPFDGRHIFYESKLVWRAVEKVMMHFINGENVGLTIGRQGQVVGNIPWCLVFVTKNITDINLYYRGGNVAMPLYLYPDTVQKNMDGKQTREPNLDPDIVRAIAAGIGLRFTPEKQNDAKTFAPIDVLDYIYAVLHAPAYREKYKAFLKIDFPRVPYPTDQDHFRQLAKLGGELRALHLMESPTLDKLITGYPVAGDHAVTKPEFQLTDHKAQLGKVCINKTQHFTNVPAAAWNFHIGGYQPAQKWLKDRKGRRLNTDDLNHYQKIIVALTETERVMGEIDEIGV